MAGDSRQVVIIHAGAAHALIVKRIAARLDNMQRRVHAGGEPDQAAGVLRDVGLEEGEVHY